MNNYLYHHGVKGMKWGVRKSKKKYVSSNKFDISRYGRRGANRIEKRMAEKGYSRSQAQRAEYHRQVMIGAALCAGYFALSYPSFVQRKVAKGVAGAGRAAGTVVGAASKATGGYRGKNALKYVLMNVKNAGRKVTYL